MGAERGKELRLKLSLGKTGNSATKWGMVADIRFAMVEARCEGNSDFNVEELVGINELGCATL